MAVTLCLQISGPGQEATEEGLACAALHHTRLRLGGEQGALAARHAIAAAAAGVTPVLQAESHTAQLILCS